MGLPAEAAETILEHGGVTFLYRPRVEEQHPAELDDVQRLLILLAPDGGAFERLIAIGRKRIERFWGFVDLVLTPYDMNAALGAYAHLPAAKSFADGAYELAWHNGHTHLRWYIGRFDTTDPVAAEIGMEQSADYILTVANPDPSLWGLGEMPNLQSDLFDDLELHVTIPTPFPPTLEQRFRGRKYAQVDTPEWLDHPGAELVFVGAGAA